MSIEVGGEVKKVKGKRKRKWFVIALATPIVIACWMHLLYPCLLLRVHACWIGDSFQPAIQFNISLNQRDDACLLDG